MKENVNLIKEINVLKREKKFLKDDVSKKQTTIATNLLSKKKNMSGIATENYEEMIAYQRDEVKLLQDKLKEVSTKNQALKDKRPPSSGSNKYIYNEQFLK